MTVKGMCTIRIYSFYIVGKEGKMLRFDWGII